jgi:hypothetical protein
VAIAEEEQVSSNSWTFFGGRGAGGGGGWRVGDEWRRNEKGKKISRLVERGGIAVRIREGQRAAFS